MSQKSQAPAFLLLVEGREQVGAAQTIATALAGSCAPILGTTPLVEVVAMSDDGAPPVDRETLSNLDAELTRMARKGHHPVFLLPAVLDLSLSFKQRMGASIREAQRKHPDISVFCDDIDPCHPLLLYAFVDAAAECLSRLPGAAPSRTGILLVADGEGDPPARARAYQLMRLLWEQLSAARGEVAFLRHESTPLPEKLEECARTGLRWVLVPQYLWTCEHLNYAKLIAEDFSRRTGGEAAWPMARPIGPHPNIEGWLQQRLLELYKSHRDAHARRASSPRNVILRPARIHGPRATAAISELGDRIGPDLRYDEGIIADLSDPADLALLLEHKGMTGDLFFVKVTWHGYAPGTYTDPVALDTLLSALPGRAVVVEGHTASRNRGGADWDWEREARKHRTWIRREEQHYLERTGLQDVIAKHGASYVNVTEAWWDGACADAQSVHERLAKRGVHLHDNELIEYVPKIFLEHPEARFISFARFKGPTRLSLSNLFGLIPVPLRSAWHGPNLTYLARVCCDLAKLYGTLFETFGIVEGLNAAVRWDRKGLYRSRWGNYDLIDKPGLLTASRGFSTADVLASRLQGQDVSRSAFFDVVQHELGYSQVAAHDPIEPALVRRLT